MKTLTIIPKPTSINIKKNVANIEFDGKFKIIANSKCQKIAEQLKSIITTDTNAKKKIELEIDPSLNTLGEEGYRLHVKKTGFILTACSLPGMFYATRSLLQLLPPEFEIGQTKSFSLPNLEIEDRPRFVWRGFLLDSARHFQSVSLIKKLIDRMASLKLNRLHWHCMDNEACRIQFDEFPELAVAALTANSPGIYSLQDVQEIIDYAAERYITVYPEVEIPGHSRSVLSIYPNLHCPVDEMEKQYKQYCMANPDVMTFLKKLVDQIVKIFQPPYLHIGGDEACTTHWEKCPLCCKQLSDLKLKDFHQYQKFFMKEITDYISQCVSESIEWADHLELSIPQKQIIQTWHEGEAEKALESGHRIICSEHEFVYFDYPQSNDELKRDFMLPLDIETVYKFEPIPLDTKNPDLILGGEACIWTEDILEEKLFYKIFPRLFAFAEAVWSNSKNRSYKEFLPRVKNLCHRFEVLGLDYYKNIDNLL